MAVTLTHLIHTLGYTSDLSDTELLKCVEFQNFGHVCVFVIPNMCAFVIQTASGSRSTNGFLLPLHTKHMSNVSLQTESG